MGFKINIDSSGFQDVENDIDDLRDYLDMDLTPLIPRAKEIIRLGQARMTEAGTDRFGKKLLPIEPETQDRRTRAGKGSGQPLTPDGQTSSPYKKLTFFARKTKISEISISIGWPGAYWLAYHAAGIQYRAGVKIRDVMGVDPQTMKELEQLIVEYVMTNGSKIGRLARLRRSASKTLKNLFGG